MVGEAAQQAQEPQQQLPVQLSDTPPPELPLVRDWHPRSESPSELNLLKFVLLFKQSPHRRCPFSLLERNPGFHRLVSYVEGEKVRSAAT